MGLASSKGSSTMLGGGRWGECAVSEQCVSGGANPTLCTSPALLYLYLQSWTVLDQANTSSYDKLLKNHCFSQQNRPGRWRRVEVRCRELTSGGSGSELHVRLFLLRLSFWKPAPCGEGGQTKRPEAKHGQSLRGFARLGSITCDACLTRAPEACGAECLGDHHCSSARIPARRARIQDLVNPAARPAAWWLLGSSHGMEVRQVNNPFPGESI